MTEAGDVLAILKWVVGLTLPVLTALCTTVAVLWRRLCEKSRGFEEDRDRMNREWRDQLERIAQAHRAEMSEVWRKQNELLVQVNRTIEHVLHLPRSHGGASRG